jgi:uncharacterized protein YktB (UPF0637 family)
VAEARDSSPPARSADVTAFAGFTAAVFDLFSLETFEERMGTLRLEATPRLSALGATLARDLTLRLDAPAYAHVARHLRRHVHPPQDTWVAWSTSPRGYKSQIHFEAGVQAQGAFLRLTALPEAGAVKSRFLAELTPELLTAKTEGPWSVSFTPDHHGAEEVSVTEAAGDWDRLVRRAGRAQSGFALVIHTPRQHVIERGGDYAADVLSQIDQLLPLLPRL